MHKLLYDAAVHTAGNVKEFLAFKQLEILDQLSYSQDLVPADYIRFPKVKTDLTGDHIDQEEFKRVWNGVTANLKKEDFTKANMN